MRISGDFILLLYELYMRHMNISKYAAATIRIALLSRAFYRMGIPSRYRSFVLMKTQSTADSNVTLCRMLPTARMSRTYVSVCYQVLSFSFRLILHAPIPQLSPDLTHREFESSRECRLYLGLPYGTYI